MWIVQERGKVKIKNTMAAPLPDDNLFERRRLYLEELKKGSVFDPVEQAKSTDDPTRDEEAMVSTIDLASVKEGWTEGVMDYLVQNTDASVKRKIISKIFSDIPKQFGEFEKKILASFTVVVTGIDGTVTSRTVDAESLYIIYMELVVHDMQQGAGTGSSTKPWLGEHRLPYLSALSDEQRTALTKYVVETRMGIPESRERMEKLYDFFEGRLHELEKKWIKEGKIQPKTYKSDQTCTLVFSGDKTVSGEVPAGLLQMSKTMREMYGVLEEHGVGERRPWVITEAQTKDDFLLVVKDMKILVEMFAAQGIPWREQSEFDNLSDAEIAKLMDHFTKAAKPLRHAEIMTRVVGRMQIQRDVYELNPRTKNVENIGFNATSIFARQMLDIVTASMKGKDHVQLVTDIVEQLWISDDLLRNGKFKTKAEVVRAVVPVIENFSDLQGVTLTASGDNNNNNEDLDELTNRFDKTFKRGTERSGIRAIPGKDGEKVQAPNDARRK